VFLYLVFFFVFQQFCINLDFKLAQTTYFSSIQSRSLRHSTVAIIIVKN
jgi:hypothetical protein